MAKRKSRRLHKGAVSKVLDSRTQEKGVKMERHHRLPRSRGGRSSPENLIILSEPVHRAWHYLFGNANAQEVARMVSDVFIDPDYYFVATPRHKPSQKKRRTRCICTDCGAEVMKLLPTTTKHDDNDDLCDCRACYALGDD